MILSESPANAGVLKNGVRVGDRSKMNITRVPRAGTRNRIQAPGAARKAAPKARSPRKARHAWFWESHDPKAPASAAKWDAALSTLRDRRGNGQRILADERIRKISLKWREPIVAAARKHNISEILLLAVVATESLGNEKAKSPKGAEGLMQLIPATAARFGVIDSFDPVQNINGGAAYLAFLLAKFDEDPVLALAGYNAGENAVVKHGGVPPYIETRDYVAKVFDVIAGGEVLCLVKLTGPRDTCLWRPPEV
ncbi:MAG: lytic transglycosylase domain-containing protein [Pseudomonadota bacterium]